MGNLDPNHIIPLFAPLFFGVVIISAHFDAKSPFPKIISTWSKFVLVHLFLALFASFGYAGNLGILTGFISSACAFFALLVIFGEGEFPATSLNIEIKR